MYSIDGLCPNREHAIGGFGFSIKLYPQWKEIVAASGLDQVKIEQALSRLGREWLDVCGFDAIFDPDNCGFEADKKCKPGPDARPSYLPNRDLRVSWGEWGVEHISVPGNACGLDVGSGPGGPRNGKVLWPHNVDGWHQVQLLLITFCWFADSMMLTWDLTEGSKP